MSTRISVIASCLLSVAFCAIVPNGQSAETHVDYATQIKPILRGRCFACHGGLKQEAGLRLDTVELMLRGGDSGGVISPGDASQSLLMARVTASDAAERMPPETEGDPLTPPQLQLLRDWIAAGAPAPPREQPEPDPRDHWAYRPIVRPPVPEVGESHAIRNPVDAFLAQQHQRQELVSRAEAPRILLARRLYFDLIGLPPSAEQIERFESDRAPGWYERAVDRLLDDPRHGERWSRHWMDIWRYSDWWGLGAQLRNSQQHIWHWRDWIIASLNADLPYDEMVRLMLAADELHPSDLDKLRATGYLARNYFLFNRDQWMEETVEHVSKAFLGLTMNCAKCHDHKYDPITQADFYRMRAFFEPYHVRLDMLPGQPDLNLDGVPRVFDGWPDAPTYRFVRGQESNPDKSEVIPPGVPEILAFHELRIEPVALPADAWQPVRRHWVFETYRAAAAEKIALRAAAVLQARSAPAVAESADRAAARDEARFATGDEKAAVIAQAKLKAAEAALALAESERVSLERRAAAMQAAWTSAEIAPGEAAPQPADPDRAHTIAAVQAERQVEVATARHRVAEAEVAALAAAEDQRDASDQQLKAAREALQNAVADAEKDVQTADRFTPLVGAQWTATRFQYSGQDDPTVEFLAESTGRRRALADWITDPRHPLTARVAANHIWMRHMGAPLVSTVFDFGRNGARPTHPELLDWLASELIDSGWSMKHLHRLIVNSAAYRRSSSVKGEQATAARDPDNRFWWRRMPIRLESQAVRDGILALAGTLDLTRGGPPVLPDQQAESKRRSLYFFHSNNERNLFLTTFDEARVTDCYRREQSIVPQQALALTNSQLVLDAAPQIARRLSADAADEEAFVRTAFKVIIGVEAREAEVSAATEAVTAWRRLPGGSAEQARSQLVWALLNHNDFVTLR